MDTDYISAAEFSSFAARRRSSRHAASTTEPYDLDIRRDLPPVNLGLNPSSETPSVELAELHEERKSVDLSISNVSQRRRVCIP